MSLPSEAHVTFELCSFINPDLGEPMTYSRHMNSESLNKDNQSVNCFSKTGIAECCYLDMRFDQLIFFAHDRILGPIILAGESSQKDTNGISVFKITFGQPPKVGGCRGNRRSFRRLPRHPPDFLLIVFRIPDSSDPTLYIKQCHILALVVPFRRNLHNISTTECNT